MRKLLLALPLASLVFAAGCGCVVKDDCDACVATAPIAAIATVADAGAPVEIVSASIKPGDVLTMEQYEKLVAEGKVTLPERRNAVAAAPKAEPVVVEEPIVVAETRVEPVVVAVKEEPVVVERPVVRRPAPAPAPAPVARTTPSGLRTIPAMALPEGWSYIHEEDLTGGRLSTVEEQFYSQIDRDAKGGS